MAQRLQIPLPPTFLDHPGDPRVRWKNWKAQLDNFFTLTDLTLAADNKLSNKAKNAYLATLLGSEGSRILMANSVAPAASTDTYDDFAEKVKALFERPANPVRAEFEFRSRKQGATETVSEYMTALRTLYSECTHTANNDNHDLAMQLAIGCYSRHTQEKLLAEPTVALDRFVQIMEADEAASTSSAVIRNAATVAAANVNKQLTYKNKGNNARNAPGIKQQHGQLRRPCAGCGKMTHAYKDPSCPAFKQTCNLCGKLNHFSKCCYGAKHNKNKNIASTSIKSASKSQAHTPEIRINVRVTHGHASTNYSAMVDTGSEISTMSQTVFNNTFPGNALQECSIAIHNFDGSIVQSVLGTFTAEVQHKDTSCTATLYIVKADLPAVVGRDLVSALNIQIHGESLQAFKTSKASHQGESLDLLLRKYPSLISEELGTYPDYQHVITLRADSKPTVTKLRTIPLAKREAVDREIDRMMSSGIWSPIDRSEWAHAIVAVNKSNSNEVRITSDLSPLNQFIVPVRHPHPPVSDSLLQLRGATHYTKLDLKKGFFHILLSEQSRPLTATLTPKGLMAYNRLPMGMCDSSAVFIKCVAQTLVGCTNVVQYVDDILVYGSTQQEHDAALDKVLAALAQKDFRLNLAKCKINENSVTFLGHRIDATGVHPCADRLAPLRDAPTPTNKRPTIISWCCELHCRFYPKSGGSCRTTAFADPCR